jgi:hypothetical protein
MARYEHMTIHMAWKGDKEWVRWQQGTPESSQYKVLAEHGGQGWKYLGWVPTPGNSGELVLERERP